MKKCLVLIFMLLLFCLNIPHVFAQSSLLPEEPKSQQEYFVKAYIIKVLKEGSQELHGYHTITQTLQVKILEGTEKDKVITIQRGNDYHISSSQKIAAGTTVILDVITRPGTTPIYTITDTYRLPWLLYLTLGFFLFTIFLAGKKGGGAILGLCISLFIIMSFIIPQILAHQDPLVISCIGSTAILLTTTYLAHGFSRQTSIAVLSTFLSLIVTIGLSLLCVHLATLAGLGTEDSYLLELNPTQAINPKGLLLAGIIIGTLGALNDVTTTQVTTIFTLAKHSTKLSFLELAEQGFIIGREHILSLVNTLILAYAGASLTMFIFFALNPAHLPWWVIVNNETVSEEIVRTIAGSMGLILAVPITTFLAAWIVKKTPQIFPLSDPRTP